MFFLNQIKSQYIAGVTWDPTVCYVFCDANSNVKFRQVFVHESVPIHFDSNDTMPQDQCSSVSSLTWSEL